jgi:hypothetical protein
VKTPTPLSGRAAWRDRGGPGRRSARPAAGADRAKSPDPGDPPAPSRASHRHLPRRRWRPAHRLPGRDHRSPGRRAPPSIRSAA